MAHELDELLQHSGAGDLTFEETQLQEDILKHYGVKGMKWKNRKDPEENTEDEAAGGGGEGGEDDGDFFDELSDDLKDIMGKMGSKAQDVKAALKKGLKNANLKKRLKDLKKRAGKLGAFGKDKFYDVQESHYRRQNTKNLMKTMRVAEANGGSLPKGYKAKQFKVSSRQVEQLQKVMKKQKAQAAKQKKKNALDNKVKTAKRKGLDRP